MFEKLNMYIYLYVDDISSTFPFFVMLLACLNFDNIETETRGIFLFGLIGDKTGQ